MVQTQPIRDNKTFAADLERRTLLFAVDIVRLSGMLPKTQEAGVLRTQLTKAATSIGANYREANRARSRADVRSRINICQSEASETQYWLEIIREMKWLAQKKMDVIYLEASELLALFTSIGKGLS